MTKVPRAGNVKTRLQSFLSAAQCVSLSEAFLEDAINKAKGRANNLITAFSPSSERDYFTKFENDKFTLLEQKGENLGEKMFNAFQFAFEHDSDAIVMIGTDSPTFPAEFIHLAFENLKNADAVLGETEDGGFYLIGLRTLRKEIFSGVEWSSAKTFEQTTENIRKVGLKLFHLPIWFDVDFPEDLVKLRNNLTENSDIAPKTFHWLKENVF
ncbi:MAG: TIGR04282 family arsenosugar biosynthesis glycosyltransferase [Acidobacteriota bacterium]